MQEYDINFYKQLEDDYDYIVPRREHIFDNNFNKLDKSRYEIMLNDCCVCNCPYFSKHYALISEVNRKYADQSPWEILGQENSQKIMECFIPNEIISSVKEYTNKIFKDLDKNGMHLTKKQVLDFIDRGFTRFKITGREMSSQDFYNDLSQDLTINYLLKRSK
jgi:hypothetical protein